jgi:hypothetical protein
VPIIDPRLTMPTRSRKCRVAHRVGRQRKPGKQGAQITALDSALPRYCSWRICFSPSEDRHMLSFTRGAFTLRRRSWRQAIAREDRPSSARGTGPMRNTVPQKLPHPQRASVDWIAVVPFAQSSSTLDVSACSRPDFGAAALFDPLCRRLVVLAIATNVHQDIVTELPHCFLDTSQGSGHALTDALFYGHRVRGARAQGCMAAMVGATNRLRRCSTTRAMVVES